MVGLGFTEIGTKQLEVKDVYDITKVCSANLADFPHDKFRGAVGGLISETYPVICGGKTAAGVIVKNCYKLGTLETTLLTELCTPRHMSAGVMYNNDTLWVTG
jgi:hypothetical protein